MSWIYHPEKLTAKLLFLFLCQLTVKGKENIPDNGAVLVVANHLSVADPVLLGFVLGRKVEFLAKEELFRSRLSSYFVRGFGAFPVYKGRQNIDAMRWSRKVLEKGGALAMFPEGKRSKNASLETAYAGSALIALKNNVPILPVGISGTEKIKGWSWWFKHHPEVTASIGKPFYLPPDNCKPTRSQLNGCTELIMRSIAGQLPESYRGEYGG